MPFFHPVCDYGDIRLAGGEHEAIGRVEICMDNTWGTVCDLDWDDQDALPVCRSLGFIWGKYSTMPAYLLF